MKKFFSSASKSIFDLMFSKTNQIVFKSISISASKIIFNSPNQLIFATLTLFSLELHLNCISLVKQFQKQFELNL